MTATITRSTMETYHIRTQGEWATIAIKGWQAKGYDDQPREIGEILINSSYGAWAYQWGHLGLPFKQWLAKADDPSYIAGKFLAAKAYTFDGEKSVRELRRRLIEWHRRDSLTKTEAREIWDWIEDNKIRLETSDRDFIDGLIEAQADITPTDGARRFLSEPWELAATSLNRSFASFWRVIWPVFQQELRRELMTIAA